MTPELSIVIPALDEKDNLGPLIGQMHDAVIERGIITEVIVVDDGSTDGTLATLKALAAERPWLRVLHRDQPMGQSAAMHAGIGAAVGRFIATLDADLQNDPADLVKMLERIREGDVDMVQGDRSANRRDNLVRRFTSVIGRKARAWVVGDPTRDTGCSARVVRAEIAKQFPLQFKGMHRFMPAYARMLGARVVEMPVHHRPRAAGRTKYGFGIWQRAIPGLFDCFALRWMGKRMRDTTTTTAPGDAK